jgi:hypothetical protein
VVGVESKLTEVESELKEVFDQQPDTALMNVITGADSSLRLFFSIKERITGRLDPSTDLEETTPSRVQILNTLYSFGCAREP